MKDTIKREYLQKLIAGKLSVKDQHLLEREALDDPFLFEALEGYAYYSADELKLLYSRPQKSQRIVSMQTMAIAATIIILIGSMFLLRQSEKSPEEIDTHIAMDISKEKQLDSSSFLTLNKSQKESIDFNKLPVEVAIHSANVPAKEIQQENDIENSSTITIVVDQPITIEEEDTLFELEELDEIIVSGSDVVRSKQTSGSIAIITIEDTSNQLKIKSLEKVTIDDIASADQESKVLIIEEKEIKTSSITGTVVDSDGEPLIGANIICSESNNGTISDLDGTFSLDRTSDCQSLIFSFTGFQPQEIEIGSSTLFHVELEGSQLLDEVVVTGYGKQNDHNPSPKIYGAATPDVGEPQLKELINEEIDRSICTITGNISLEMIVRPNGSLGIITFNQKLSKKCKNEIRRVLKSTGTWTSNPPKKRTKIKYLISIE